jgi:excisionase family DNA binding protein
LVSEVAERLRCSLSNVYNLVAQGRLKCYRVGSGRAGLRFTESQVQAFLLESEQTLPGRESTSPASEKAAGFTMLDEERLRRAWEKR